MENFLKNGSGWSILNLERFDINVYEYKPFGGSTYIKFKDIAVKFEGKEISLDSELSGRKAIINMQNDDNECFKWAIACALNPVKDNPQRITKELRKQAEQYDWSKIPFQTPYRDRSVYKFEKKNNISIIVYAFRWEYSRKLEEMEPLIFPLRLSEIEGDGVKEVNLFYVTNEREELEDCEKIQEGEKEFEIASHYCVITSLSMEKHIFVGDVAIAINLRKI